MKSSKDFENQGSVSCSLPDHISWFRSRGNVWIHFSEFQCPYLSINFITSESIAVKGRGLKPELNSAASLALKFMFTNNKYRIDSFKVTQVVGKMLCLSSKPALGMLETHRQLRYLCIIKILFILS